jgi:hypothetical protein
VTKKKRGPRQLANLPTAIETSKATRLEGAALAYARGLVRWLRDEKLPLESPGMPPQLVSFLDVADAERWGANRMMAEAMLADGERSRVNRLKAEAMQGSAMTIVDLVDLAPAWGLADRACRELVQEYERRGERKPPALGVYTQRLAAGRLYSRRGGWDATRLVMRNVTIAHIVAGVCSRFDLKPLRNLRSRLERASGCSITARALKEECFVISETAVAKIWDEYGYFVLTGDRSRI